LRQVAASFARRTRVLCIDEFGVHDIGDAMLIHGLLEALLRQGVTLVCTSNTPPGQLYANGLQRARFLPAIELLQTQLDVMEIGAGPDYRLRELEGSPTWFDSGDAATEGKMQRLFRALAGDAGEGAPATVEIEGRSLPVRNCAHGMLWFDFATLCEGPRSSGDYIALADEWHTLFLSDIPVLTSASDDAARRLVSLVDELYDRRVKLVASAAAGPEQLYRGERLRDSFARTVSRLIEMRSPAYLGGAHVSGVAVRERA
jgi:cell division protein ZapE